MTFLLIAAIAIGLGAAGLVRGLPALVGWSAPRWLAPAAGGLAMFAFMLWNEYTWFERSLAALPPGTVVAESYEHASVFQPWTLAAPRVTRFAAVRPRGRTAEGYLEADVILAARFTDDRAVPHLFDCRRGRRAVLPPGEGPVKASALDWAAPADDPLIKAACAASLGEPSHDRNRPAG